ncbi:hypothetical protein SLEP1_g43023 [Rubroshorea leprosula]|uniref:Secreted protein n=1 Tax=Rubroshorea leprosula TaxID=152421 RepID=A0AAV5LBN9_9ROSI|nr:hypothetical protein SLEP1_g43023 [Rubroshorea leprosula]
MSLRMVGSPFFFSTLTFGLPLLHHFDKIYCTFLSLRSKSFTPAARNSEQSVEKRFSRPLPLLLQEKKKREKIGHIPFCFHLKVIRGKALAI